MSNINIDLLIQDNSWKSEKDINKKLMEDIFKLVLNYLKTLIYKNKIQISITLTDDKTIKSLNKNHRMKDKTTNVLSFSFYKETSNAISDIEKMPFVVLGDIVFSYETIKKESIEQNKTFLSHFTHMLIHSYLHLIAYDHIEKKDQTKMEAIEVNILKSLNIQNPYI